MKLFLAGLIIGMLTIGSFQYFSSDTPKQPSAPIPTTLSNSCQLNCTEYEKLQATQQKYEQAKEMAPTAMLAFLVAIGARLAQGTQTIVQKLAQEPERFAEILKENAQALENEKRAQRAEIEKEIFAAQISSTPTTLPRQTTSSSNRPVDLKKQYNSSRYLTNPKALIRINGYYGGEVRFFAGKYKGATHQISLSMQFEVRNDKEVDGTYTLEMRKQGEAYSTNRGDGGNKSVRVTEDRKLILEASPNSYFVVDGFREMRFDDFKAKYIEGFEEVGIATFRRQ